MKIFIICIMCLFLAACATGRDVQKLSSSRGVASKVSYAHAERQKWQSKAEANDADAQFQMGNSYCCGDNGYFDTVKAIEWWCRASRQGHRKARKAVLLHDKNKQCVFSK